MALQDRHCRPTTVRLDTSAIPPLLSELPDWTVCDNRLEKTFQWPNFIEAMAFLNRMATIAEAENHHPDFCVHYNQVNISLWTHSAGGLSENDFILAAKIDALAIST